MAMMMFRRHGCSLMTLTSARNIKRGWTSLSPTIPQESLALCRSGGINPDLLRHAMAAQRSGIGPPMERRAPWIPLQRRAGIAT
jgi:hypothetical protein